MLNDLYSLIVVIMLVVLYQYKKVEQVQQVFLMNADDQAYVNFEEVMMMNDYLEMIFHCQFFLSYLYQ
jgi:hypothetical protein